jgi:hypothetical protein
MRQLFFDLVDNEDLTSSLMGDTGFFYSLSSIANSQLAISDNELNQKFI